MASYQDGHQESEVDKRKQTEYWFQRLMAILKDTSIGRSEQLKGYIENAYRARHWKWLKTKYIQIANSDEYINAQINPDPFPKLSPENLGNSGVIIGKEKSVGEPFYWDTYRLNALIMGSIGRGKTNLIRRLATQIRGQGGSIWIFQKRWGDYDPLIKTSIPNVVVIPGTYKWSIFRPPAGVAWDEWRDVSMAAFAHAHEFLQASHAYARSALSELYNNKYAGTENYPTFNEFFRAVEARDPKGYGRERLYYDTVMNRSKDIVERMGKCFEYSQGYKWESLSEGARIVVFHLPYDDVTADWLAMTLIYYMRTYRENNPRSEGYPPLMFAADDFRYMIRKKTGFQHFIADIDRLVTTSRIFNLGFVFADQMPSQVADSITGNTELKICFNIQAKEVIKSVPELMGLTWQQRDAIYSLDHNKGDCIVRLESARCPYPFRLEVPLFEHDALMVPISPQELHGLCQPELEKLEMESRVKPKEEQKSEEAPKDEKKKAMFDEEQSEKMFLLKQSILRYPFKNIKERAVDLKWSESAVSRLAKKMAENGMLRRVECSQGGQGGSNFVLYEVIEKKGQPINRDICHDYLLDQMQKRIESFGLEVTTNHKDYTGKIPDMVIKLHWGELPVELQASGTVSNAITHMADRLQAYRYLLMVFCNAQLMKASQQRAQQEIPQGKGKIEFLSFEQFMVMDFRQYER